MLDRDFIVPPVVYPGLGRRLHESIALYTIGCGFASDITSLLRPHRPLVGDGSIFRRQHEDPQHPA